MIFIFIYLPIYLSIYFFLLQGDGHKSSDAENQKQTSKIKKERSLPVNYQPACAKGDKVHPIKSRENDHDMAGWKVNTHR